MRVAKSRWEWFGNAGHLIVGRYCQFHLCTKVGDFLVSTVGEYVPDAPVREIVAQSRGVELSGKGDARLADYMQEVGFETVGFGRLYETFVFRLTDERCADEACDCQMPVVADWGEIDSDGYNKRGDAQRGHYEMCAKVARL